MEDRATFFNEGQLILIDKPLTWTSFDAVKKVRNLCRAKKVGHAGTLDPLATGLLIVCTGKMTKQIADYQGMPKVYEAKMILGSVTESYDLETESIAFGPYAHITEADIVNSFAKFIGEIDQTPPVYSAVRSEGKRAYQRVRDGEEVVLKSKKVHVSAIDFTSLEGKEVSFTVHCGKGTYIRSLAHDIGQDLGCGAHLSYLRRVAIGEYLVRDAISPEEFGKQLLAKEAE